MNPNWTHETLKERTLEARRALVIRRLNAAVAMLSIDAGELIYKGALDYIRAAKDEMERSSGVIALAGSHDDGSPRPPLWNVNSLPAEFREDVRGLRAGDGEDVRAAGDPEMQGGELPALGENPDGGDVGEVDPAGGILGEVAGGDEVGEAEVHEAGTIRPESASQHDGWRGARDGAILSLYAEWVAGMKVPEAVRVQCTRQTKDLLKRAGIRRPGWGDFYGVRVRLNPRFSRLELA